MMLEFNIRNQEISRIDNFSPAEKSVEYLIAKFNFKTEDWKEAIKRAIFRNVKSKVEKDAMLEDDACIVPWEVLVGSGEIEVSVHGVGKETITTDVATFNLDRTLSGGSASEKPSPTVYEQMLKEMQETKDIAQSVRDDADQGKFNGKDGKDGKDGEGGTSNIDEEQLLKFAIKTTTEVAPFHHITDSAEYKVLDFGMEGITEQYTGTITDDEGNEVTVPNPTHPQEIKLAGVLNEETGRYEHKCCVGNKNLCDLKPIETAPQNAYCEITVVEDTVVKISVPSGEAHGIYFTRLRNTITDTVVTPYVRIGVGGSATYTLPVGTYRLNFIAWDSSAGTYVVFQPIKVQIEVGNVKTDYIPHASQPFTLTSDRPLTMWDKLVKRDGVWGWSIWSELLNVTDGTVGGGMHGSVFRIDLWYNIKTNLFTEGFCNKFLWDKYGRYTHGYCGVWNSGRICFSVKPSYLGITDTTNFNANEVYQTFKDKVLSEGISICYKTSEEQAFIPLPDEEQELLNNLETYYGVTNVYNEQGCPMWLTYVSDTKLYVDQKLLEIQQAII